MVTLLQLREGEFSVTAVSVTEGSALIGTRPADLHLPEGCTTAAVLHESKVLPADSTELLIAGDELVMVLREGAACDIETLAPEGSGQA